MRNFEGIYEIVKNKNELRFMCSFVLWSTIIRAQTWFLRLLIRSTLLGYELILYYIIQEGRLSKSEISNNPHNSLIYIDEYISPHADQ